MNALFITFSSFSPVTGVGKKISAQMEAIMNNGFGKVFYGSIGDGVNFFIEDNNYGPMVSISKPINRYYHLSNIIDFVVNNNVKFIYYRFYYPSEPATIFLFYKLKKMGIKMVMEIPTYPYDGEIKIHNRFYYLDVLTRQLLAKQFDYLITFNDDLKIFGKETITISNGINLNNLPLQNVIPHSDFNLLGVANLTYWHGFDRVITGLAEFYKNNYKMKVNFHIVSGKECECIDGLIKLTKEYNLTDRVVFHGEVDGKDLDHLFNLCDVAIGSLGRHRNNIHQLKTLKNVEYAARGVPFIYSEMNTDFDGMPYVLKETESDNPINIERIIKFRNNLKISPEEIRNSVKSLSWDNQIYKILKKLKISSNESII